MSLASGMDWMIVLHFKNQACITSETTLKQFLKRNNWCAWQKELLCNSFLIQILRRSSLHCRVSQIVVDVSDRGFMNEAVPFPMLQQRFIQFRVSVIRQTMVLRAVNKLYCSSIVAVVIHTELSFLQSFGHTHYSIQCQSICHSINQEFVVIFCFINQSCWVTPSSLHSTPKQTVFWGCLLCCPLWPIRD